MTGAMLSSLLPIRKSPISWLQGACVLMRKTELSVCFQVANHAHIIHNKCDNRSMDNVA